MSDKCSKCNDTFNPVSDKDLIGTCCDCGGCFHAKCCSNKVWQAWTKRNAKREEWRCDSCKMETASSHSKSDNESGNNSVLSVLKDLRKEISDNHQDTKHRFDCLDKSLTTLRESVEESQRRISVLEDENKTLREQLESYKVISESNSVETKKLRQELLELQQYSRRNNLEIKGIPFTRGENVYTILERISQALGVPWSNNNISIAHRLPAPQSTIPAIVVAFVCRTVKNVWLSAARSKKLKTTDLSSNLPPGPVYINCQLAPHNRQLLGRARQLVRDRKLGSAWASDDGRVLVRTMSGSHPCRVSQMEDLDGFVE